MIFSMNYGVVAPLQGSAAGSFGRRGPAEPGAARAGAAGDGHPDRDAGPAREPGGGQGAAQPDRLRPQPSGAGPGGEGTLGGAGGRLLRVGPAEPTRVIVDAAQLGEGLAFAGSGEVAVLTFRVRGAARPTWRKRSCATWPTVPGSVSLIADGGKVLDPSAAPVTLPTAVEFRGALPNPFVGRTDLVFALPAEAGVTLRIYDVGGRLVRTLADGVFAAGEHRLTWDGRTDDGRRLGAGIYFAEFRTAGLAETRKLFLLR